MKFYSSFELAHECKRLAEWINEGRFVTIFDAQVKRGVDNDTHYPVVCLISTGKGTWNVTLLFAQLLGLKISRRYGSGRTDTLIWHGSIFDMMHDMLLKLKKSGYPVNVDLKEGHDTDINKTFRWI